MSIILSEQAKRLRKVRMYMTMTREEFAKHIHSSPFTIRSWENGQKRFGDRAIHRVVQELRQTGFPVTYEWFVHGAGVSPIALQEEGVTTANEHIKIVRDVAAEELGPTAHDELYAIKKVFPGIKIVNVMDASYKPLAVAGDFLGFRRIELANTHEFAGRIIFFHGKGEDKGFGVLIFAEQAVVSRLDRHERVDLTAIDELYELVWFRKSK